MSKLECIRETLRLVLEELARVLARRQLKVPADDN